MKKIILMSKHTGKIYLGFDMGSVSIIDIESGSRPPHAMAIKIDHEQWECDIQMVLFNYEIIGEL